MAKFREKLCTLKCTLAQYGLDSTSLGNKHWPYLGEGWGMTSQERKREEREREREREKERERERERVRVRERRGGDFSPDL